MITASRLIAITYNVIKRTFWYFDLGPVPLGWMEDEPWSACHAYQSCFRATIICSARCAVYPTYSSYGIYVNIKSVWITRQNLTRFRHHCRLSPHRTYNTHTHTHTRWSISVEAAHGCACFSSFRDQILQISQRNGYGVLCCWHLYHSSSSALSLDTDQETMPIFQLMHHSFAARSLWLLPNSSSSTALGVGVSLVGRIRFVEWHEARQTSTHTTHTTAINCLFPKRIIMYPSSWPAGHSP